MNTLSVKIHECTDRNLVDAPTVVLLPGFPDDHSLWDGIVEAILPTHRVVVACLPDFDKKVPTKRPNGKRGYSFNEIQLMFERTIEENTKPNEQFVLGAHDYGCLFSYIYIKEHPERVKQLIAIDIGANSSPTKNDSMKISAASVWYQVNFAMVYWMGSRISPRLASGWLKAFMSGWKYWGPLSRKAAPPPPTEWFKCYPYLALMSLLVKNGGKIDIPHPECPVLYIYGKQKRAMFHTSMFIKALEQRTDGSKVVGFKDAAHWVMLEKPKECNTAIVDFLKAGNDDAAM